ncbi:transmembrane protein 62-like isoform X2 [Daktulosphaira vitifoliae]|uniref:transmembrane protein 62-like isoform X2 n=1 Tax=Daktulosphaira vitifoliae TaxID=58002 RepID=UPI0021A98454|nr:transmembrane protein 62-like isoform X2 [Daktulosphaira vitifoliae]
MNNFTDRLIWFLQISDLHLSIFHDWGRVTELKEFCELTVDAIKPSAVLASGDLTDAKNKNGIGSTQYEKEWLAYHNVLISSKVSEKTKWLDIRGNHDSFDVLNEYSSNNFYKKYSIQGKKYSRSYSYSVTNQAGMRIKFIGVDACLEPGIKRPFNFIGTLNSYEINNLKKMIKNNKDPVIWFGHYPTSCILVEGNETIRKIIGKSSKSIVYLCGHLHTLAGLVPEMYTIHKEGFAELELGDWKDGRMFRLLAFDRGSLSFTDVRHGKWPVVLITNPKIPWLYVNSVETLEDQIMNNKFIRILAFSLDTIQNVLVKINSEMEWKNCINVGNNSPMYVTEWNANQYIQGIHTIHVRVEDVQGRTHEISQSFTLDSNISIIKNFAQWPLNLYFPNVLLTIFMAAIVANCLPLLFYRFISKCTKYHISYSTQRTLISKYSRKMVLLTSLNCMFYPLTIYSIILCLGPWAVGGLLTDSIGWIFPWGIYINGKFIKDPLTYAYGFAQIITFQLPLNCILGHHLDINIIYLECNQWLT